VDMESTRSPADAPIEIHAAEWRPFVTQRAEISGLSDYWSVTVASLRALLRELPATSRVLQVF
jgi:hypothetical protein